VKIPPPLATHIQQELWTYKKDKAFSMTPTEAINTLNHDNLDVHHIEDWKFCNKRGEMLASQKDRSNTTHTTLLWFWKGGTYPYSKLSDFARNRSSCCSH
jgi:hypothetical protein